jgi:four helix bundle protein
VGISAYRELEVWKKGVEVVKQTYDLTNKFRREEMYGLTSQMRKAAISIPSNIAEGFGRYHNKENRQFLYVVLGSCAEFETQVTISRELKYIGEKQEADLLEELDHIGRMTSNLIKKLRSGQLCDMRYTQNEIR